MLLIYHLMKNLQNIIILAYTNVTQWSVNKIKLKCSRFDQKIFVTLTFDNHNKLIYTGFSSVILQFMQYKIIYCNLKYLYKNGTFSTFFQNANYKNASALATTDFKFGNI